MLTDASRKFHGTLDAQKAVQKQGKMNPSGCLPEVPRNIGCAEEHRRDMDAQKAAVYGLLPELKISVTKRVLAGSQGKTRRHGKYASKSGWRCMGKQRSGEGIRDKSLTVCRRNKEEIRR